jgi:protease IV
MRRFIVRVFAGVGFFFVALIVLVVALVLWAKPREASIADGTVLTLDLTEALPDAPPAADLIHLFAAEKMTLRDAVDALQRAAGDNRIKGLNIHVGDADIGFAEVQELRDAIARFRAAGKRALAYADSFGELGSGTRGYYLASACDEIWLQPLGSLGLVGLRAEVPFFRGTFDKLGIIPRFDHREEFKTAANTLTETALTQAHREETKAILDSVEGQIVRGVAKARHLDEARVRALVEKGPLLTGQALDSRLIDHVGYRDEAMAVLDAGAEEPHHLSLARYIRAAGRPHKSGPTIALIYAHGLIRQGRADDDLLATSGSSAESLIAAFRNAAKDSSVRAILLRIDSPGGSAVASESIWRATVKAREAGKPIIVSMGDVAGSGGYYIAASADKIVAQPATLTGSIGVVGGKVVIDGLLKKLGVTWGVVQTDDNAGITSALEDFSAEGHRRFEAFLDDIYAGFKDRVARGRKLSADAVEAVAKGRVWTGEDAKSHGLVDALGGYAMALDLAKAAAGIPADQDVTIKLFPAPRDAASLIADRLFGDGDSVASSAAAGAALQALDRLRPLLAQLELVTQGDGALTMPPLEVR